MASFTLSENIQASPREVFYYLVTVENASKVLSGIKQTEKISDTPLGVGTLYVQTRQSGGREYQSEYEVVEFDSPNVYAVSTEKNGVRVTYRYVLRPEGEGTHLRMECNVVAEGLKRPLAWLVAEVMKREDGEILAKLRRALEEDQASQPQRNSTKEPVP